MAVALAQLALGLPHQATNPTLTPHKGGVKAEISTTGRALEFIDGSNLTAIAKDQQKNGRHQFKKVEKRFGVPMPKDPEGLTIRLRTLGE